MKTVEERFWPKVKKTGDCWLWTACLDNKGYGFMKVKRGSKWKNVKAHRVSYELHNEELPEDLGILHSCRNRNCVNPEHLRAGTQKENGLDMIRDGSAAAGERNGNVRLTKELVEEIRRCTNQRAALTERWQKGMVLVGLPCGTW